MEQNKVEMAFRRVTYARRIVACQRERVEMLARNGDDTTSAERILDLFARTLDIFEDGLRRILGQDSKPNRSRQAVTRACSFKRNTFNIRGPQRLIGGAVVTAADIVEMPIK